MNISNKRKQYKNRIGQANHFLITTLVGLDAIEKGVITEKPKDFSTSWNPRNEKASAIRSRDFVQKSTLAWVVESLEMYMVQINRKPKLYEEDNKEMERIFSKAGQSIFEKVTLVGDYLRIDPILIALVESLITWRNYIFHYDIDNEIRTVSFSVLESNRERIENEYCGLDIYRMIKKWRNKEAFSFKETASLISATNRYVEVIDKKLLNEIDLKRYVIESIISSFSDCEKTRIKYLSLTGEKHKIFMSTLIQNRVGICINDDDLNDIIESINKKEISNLSTKYIHH